MKSEQNQANRESVNRYEGALLAENISQSPDLHAACVIGEQHLADLGHDLLSVFFCDLIDQLPAIRPFRRLPRALSDLAVKLNGLGGCPVKRHVKNVLHPFDWFSMPEPNREDFLTARFMSEARKLGYNEVLAVPIVLGRGVAVFSIGLNPANRVAQTREQIVAAVSQICCAMISRFPELGVMFEPKRLSTLQAETLMLMSQGNNRDQIGNILGLSPLSIGLIYQSAADCLGTKNEAQTVSRAIASGEISSMEFGDYDLI